jgi:hypothetical protein
MLIVHGSLRVLYENGANRRAIQGMRRLRLRLFTTRFDGYNQVVLRDNLDRRADGNGDIRRGLP